METENLEQNQEPELGLKIGAGSRNWKLGLKMGSENVEQNRDPKLGVKIGCENVEQNQD